MGFIDNLKSTVDTWFTPRSVGVHYRYGVPGSKHTGYEAGRAARRRRLEIKVSAAEEKLARATARLESARLEVDRRKADLEYFKEGERARKAALRQERMKGA